MNEQRGNCLYVGCGIERQDKAEVWVPSEVFKSYLSDPECWFDWHNGAILLHVPPRLWSDKP